MHEEGRSCVHVCVCVCVGMCACVLLLSSLLLLNKGITGESWVTI